MRQVADELAIRNVVVLLARYADEGTLEAYGELFTPDACWEMPGGLIRKGREEIVAGGAERRAAAVAGPGTHTRHLVGTVSVALDGDRAEVESYWQFFAATDSIPSLHSMGHYRDLFQLTADGWRLHYRQITLG